MSGNGNGNSSNSTGTGTGKGTITSSSTSSTTRATSSSFPFPYSGSARYLGSMAAHSSRTHPYSVRPPASSSSSSSSSASSSTSSLSTPSSVMNTGQHQNHHHQRQSLPAPPPPPRRKDDLRPQRAPSPSPSLARDQNMEVDEETGAQSSRTVTGMGAPMPSLTSHPPLRLQRRPVVGTRLREMQGASPLVEEQQDSLLTANRTSPSPPASHPPSSPNHHHHHHHANANANENGNAYHHHRYSTSSDSATTMMMMGPNMASAAAGTAGLEEASFPCPFCPAVFRKVGHLNRHTLKHTGTRFACEIPGCEKTFSRLDNMRTQ
ncbi:hypothetical protein FRC16_010555 [Serendipita sp. 398]|nr:hypothetical protein FRC16_010555 [Serendipita sp. 398]